MRAKKTGRKTPNNSEPGFMAWRDELLGCAFEADLGLSRLMATLQIGPPKPSSPRRKRLPRRGR